MRLSRLILREISFRKLNFALGALGVAVAVGCLMAEITFLRKHDLTTERIMAAKEAETKAILAAKEAKTKEMMAKLEDDYRKITLKMGFNILILPKDQNLNDLYDEEKTPKYLPENYADKLAKSKVATINHVLPTLTQKVKWPEQSRKIVLMGVRGEVYIQSRNQKPLLEEIKPDSMVVGYELHQSLKLAEGQKVKFMGREFTVTKLMEEKGNADDITLWIDLGQAQDLLGHKGQISAIMALECNCAQDRLAIIRAEIGALLPDTKVVEFASQALARAEARTRAAEQADASLAQEKANQETMLAQEKANRDKLRHQRESFAAILVPTVLIGAGIWIALLTFSNVRDRRTEIGVLRAIGLRGTQVLGIFMGKAILMGMTGAVLGCAGGLVAGALWQQTPDAAMLGRLANPGLVIAVFAAAPLLAVLASWLPALQAAQQDPAIVLQDR